MAVFTPVTEEQAALLMSQLGLGELTALKGIEGGIENTNYFASTDLGEYVLTLFERLNHEQLPFYLFLMKHLAEKGIPVPNPAANRNRQLGRQRCWQWRGWQRRVIVIRVCDNAFGSGTGLGLGACGHCSGLPEPIARSQGG